MDIKINTYMQRLSASIVVIFVWSMSYLLLIRYFLLSWKWEWFLRSSCSLWDYETLVMVWGFLSSHGKFFKEVLVINRIKVFTIKYYYLFFNVMSHKEEKKFFCGLKKYLVWDITLKKFWFSMTRHSSI